jgi:hypothetical protein
MSSSVFLSPKTQARHVGCFVLALSKRNRKRYMTRSSVSKNPVIALTCLLHFPNHRTNDYSVSIFQNRRSPRMTLSPSSSVYKVKSEEKENYVLDCLGWIKNCGWMLVCVYKYFGGGERRCFGVRFENRNTVVAWFWSDAGAAVFSRNKRLLGMLQCFFLPRTHRAICLA